jgi:hypothetical protein
VRPVEIEDLSVRTAMSNCDQRYEQYGTASATNPLLNKTMTNFKTSAYDNPACEMNKGDVSPITSPHISTIVWGAMSLLVGIAFTILGEWVPAIFFLILGVWMTNSCLKSAKRRKPQYIPRF